MQKAVDEYNRQECSTHWSLPRTLEADLAKNPEADIWLRSEFMGSTSPVPISIKRAAIDLYNLGDRAKEEVTLLQGEMKNVIDHFCSQHAFFHSSLTDTSSGTVTAESRGRDMCIKMKIMSLEAHLVELENLFQSHIDDITLPNFLFDKEDLPSNLTVETEDDSAALLCLPEGGDVLVSDSDSDTEYESQLSDDVDSAFFSMSGL